VTQSRKQTRRQAAKARRKHYQAMREHLDKLTVTAPGTFEHLCAWQTYQMRERFIRPLYAERPQWVPPPGRARA
jgi:hypothetical protein